MVPDRAPGIAAPVAATQSALAQIRVSVPVTKRYTHTVRRVTINEVLGTAVHVRGQTSDDHATTGAVLKARSGRGRSSAVLRRRPTDPTEAMPEPLAAGAHSHRLTPDRDASYLRNLGYASGRRCTIGWRALRAAGVLRLHAAPRTPAQSTSAMPTSANNGPGPGPETTALRSMNATPTNISTARASNHVSVISTVRTNRAGNRSPAPTGHTNAAQSAASGIAAANATSSSWPASNGRANRTAGCSPNADSASLLPNSPVTHGKPREAITARCPQTARLRLATVTAPCRPASRH
jgi:hypothetical protein